VDRTAGAGSQRYQKEAKTVEEKSCENCDFAQNDICEGPCKLCIVGDESGGGSHWKPQTRFTRLSIRWDNWLDQRKNQINLLAAGVVGFVMILLMAVYMFTTTINTVARLAAEVYSQQVQIHQIQERARGR